MLVLPVVAVREGQDGAGVGGLLAQRRQHRELGRAPQQLRRALERITLNL